MATTILKHTVREIHGALERKGIINRKRYRAQLPSTRGTRPDQQAPIDKTTHAPKRYFRLDNFIRSMVYQSLKASQSAQQPTE